MLPKIELKKELQKLEKQNVCICFTGTIQTFMNIENAKILVTYNTIIIANEFKDKQELQISFDSIENMECSKGIKLEMTGNFLIEIY